jgi:hypothetical protein
MVEFVVLGLECLACMIKIGQTAMIDPNKKYVCADPECKVVSDIIISYLIMDYPVTCIIEDPTGHRTWRMYTKDGIYCEERNRCHFDLIEVNESDLIPIDSLVWVSNDNINWKRGYYAGKSKNGHYLVWDYPNSEVLEIYYFIVEK